MATDRPLVLLWINDAAPYRQGLARCEAMLAFRAGAGVLARMPRLRWLQALTAGVEGWLALPDLPERLTLTCARGTHRVQMPENILGALFHLTKPYAGIAQDQKEHRWRRRVSATLAGSTLGILGLGVIGQELARKAHTLEMHVIGTRRRPAAMPDVERVYGPDDTDAVLAASDFVLLLLPATPETRGFMNAARLKRMKPGAYLLNFGRGDLIVDADLIEAVTARTIAGAVLDVFTTEPLPAEHPFWSTEGIMVLPHIGGLHPGRDHVVAELFADNLQRFLAGQPLRETVDRARGY